MKSANVYCDDFLAGTLIQDENGFTFAYLDEYLKDTYEEMRIKNLIVANSYQFKKGIAISSNDILITRSLMSQAADKLMTIQDMHAAFVIAKGEDDQICISARSDGSINVQIIMEKMHGGGHLTGAALQRKNTTVEALKEELCATIEDYLKEVQNESNIEN